MVNMMKRVGKKRWIGSKNFGFARRKRFSRRKSKGMIPTVIRREVWRAERKERRKSPEIRRNESRRNLVLVKIKMAIKIRRKKRRSGLLIKAGGWCSEI